MASSASADKRAREEAAAWFARLNRRSVPLQSLEDFRTWRQVPGNLAAYRAVETAVRGADRLKDDPEIGAALAQALTRARPGQPALWRGAWPAGAILAAGLVVVGGWTWFGLGAGPHYATQVGEQRLVRLADGTQVRLDTDTRIAVRFADGERHVQLERGQAFFDVAHDPVRPFIVDAGAMHVRAVGTRFDVRRNGAHAQVTLVEGTVQVRTEGAQPGAWTLKPGEQVASDRTPTPVRTDVAVATGWTTGRVIFQGLPLAEAIEEVNRYSPHKIRLEADAVAAVPVTGSFEAGDTDGFASAVADLHGLIAKKAADGTIVLDAGPARGE